ncbi:hypothetical protein LARI1_G001339 [Lachnellula arida]|uniref:CFEM domain-containing protein n=1 Tax=Lachnellula arida TaxID=1316785 RepID=A0A8T9BIB1_9HELO|nr:hypothetical protein LARI1_G001339 [Lachnellula arida]
MRYCMPIGNVQKVCTTQFTTGTTVGGCNALDIACICASSGFLNNVSLVHPQSRKMHDIACCLAASCNSQDQATAVAFAKNLCTTSGATNVPSAVVCSTSKPTTNGSLTSSSASSAVASTTSATTTAKGNTGAHNLAGIVAGMGGALVAVLLV